MLPQRRMIAPTLPMLEALVPVVGKLIGDPAKAKECEVADIQTLVRDGAAPCPPPRHCARAHAHALARTLVPTLTRARARAHWRVL